MKQESAPARTLRRIAHAAGTAWQFIFCALANLRRRLLRRRLPDYAVITLDHAVSERAPDMPWWTAYIPGLKLPLSLEYIGEALRRIARDPDVKGVVFLMKGPELSLAQAQSLARLFDRFRQWDSQFRPDGRAPKRVVVHLEQAGTPAYVAACAADAVSLTPLASWDILGLRATPVYLKDTLARLGIQMDVVKIAPWKTAADRFTRAEMSEAEREQYNWLLDSLSEDIVGAIAAGRNLSPDTVQSLIDRAPLTADETLAAGLVDAIIYEDQLAEHLGETGKPVRLLPYASARGLLLHCPQSRPAQAVGVLSLTGAIIVGESRRLPIPLPILGGRTLGSASAVQQIRNARRDPGLAAVVAYVDSGGGSALASDLIWRELALLNQEKPVVVYMGDVAASGGYYIAAPARRIVAQPATLTGSIGVVVAKAVTAGALDKLQARREVVQRGQNAGLYGEDSPWSETQRAQIEGSVRHVYQEFKRRVAAGRNLDYDALDPICNGRVWTGKQALAHDLVDELGDFHTALELACTEANLPVDGSVRTRAISAPHTRLLAEPVDAAKALLGLDVDVAGELQAAAAALLQGDTQQLLGRERLWLFADGLPRFD